MFVRLFYSPAVGFFFFTEFVIFILKNMIKREEVEDTPETINSQYGERKKKHKVSDNVQHTNISKIDATYPLVERSRVLSPRGRR